VRRELLEDSRPTTDDRRPTTDDPRQRSVVGGQVARSGYRRSSDFVEVDWDTALDLVAHRFAEEKRAHGGETLAMFASAKCTNEENYLFNKFTRQVLGTNNIDHCARL
jgi:predicted molibdopterin-dependent oxidoreductase YjgC